MPAIVARKHGHLAAGATAGAADPPVANGENPPATTSRFDGVPTFVMSTTSRRRARAAARSVSRAGRLVRPPLTPSSAYSVAAHPHASANARSTASWFSGTWSVVDPRAWRPARSARRADGTPSWAPRPAVMRRAWAIALTLESPREFRTAASTVSTVVYPKVTDVALSAAVLRLPWLLR